MAWQEQLKTGASFRGVPFSTVGAEVRIGRRTVTHEYPTRDVPFSEDLGRHARRFLVDAYVLGDDYLQLRNDLIDALEAGGPGELVHPRWGVVQVHVDGYATVRETPSEGGIAHFSIPFVEQGENTFPRLVQNTVAEVDAAATELDQVSAEDFGRNFSVDGASVLSVEGLGALRKDLAGVVATVRRVTAAATAGELVRLAGAIGGDLATLIRTPVLLAQRVQGLYQDLMLAVRRPLAAIADLRSLFGSSRRPSPIVIAAATPGSTRARLLANESARADLQRRTALSNQARAISVALQGDNVQEPPVATAAKAIELRDQLLDQLDVELEQNDPPADIVAALVRLRAAVTRDVGERAEQLREVSTFTPQAVLPSVVLAHRIYQDATRAEQLEQRNAVRHPAFVPARPLEVLR